ncbi:MAG: hypothetical protein OHK0022_36070 [Roseiflexaceae bacterium]
MLWDEPHLKALLRIVRTPAQLLQEEPWAGWIARHGGIKTLHADLLTCELPPPLLELLKTILEHPYASAQAYADLLSISRSAYFYQLNQLIPALLHHLNRQEHAEAAEPHAEPEAPEPPPSPPAPEPFQGLPAPRGLLIGNEATRADASTTLRRPEVRLLTLTGPAGIGKTCLALQVAEELRPAFRDGVLFIPLATLHQPDFVLSSIAAALGIKESVVRPLAATLGSALRQREILLVLDNFEHLVEAAPLVSALLTSAPGIKVLATSRTALRLSGEFRLEVPPLGAPDPAQPLPPERLVEFPAVRLFVERAQAIKHGFALSEANAQAVAEICARLDGLPLAIELAAMRINLLSPEQIRNALDDRLAVLTGGARDWPERQQTLRSALAWSYDLLSPEEQQTFRRLAVFANGFSLEAVAAVCSSTQEPATLLDAGPAVTLPLLDLIASLIDKSLLLRHSGNDQEYRFTMLETIRAYALEQLHASGEERTVRARHAAYYLALAEAAKPEFYGEHQRAWVERVAAEQDNLRAALKWAKDQGEQELLWRLVDPMANFWRIHGNLSEGRAWVDLVLARPLPDQARSSLLESAATLAYSHGDYTAAHHFFQEGLALARALDETARVARQLVLLGYLHSAQGAYAEARAAFEESLTLFRSLGYEREAAAVLNHLGIAAMLRNDLSVAHAALEEGLRRQTNLGDASGMAQARMNLGIVMLLEGDVGRAEELLATSLVELQETRTNWAVPHALLNLAKAAAQRNDARLAGARYHQALQGFTQRSDRIGLAYTLENLAVAGSAQGEADLALELWGAAEALRDEMRAPHPPVDQVASAEALARLRDRLGEQRAQEARARGRARPIDQTINVALGLAERLAQEARS